MFKCFFIVFGLYVYLKCICRIFLFLKFKNCYVCNEYVVVFCLLFNCINYWLNIFICFNVFYVFIVFNDFVCVCIFVFVLNVVIVYLRWMYDFDLYLSFDYYVCVEFCLWYDFFYFDFDCFYLEMIWFFCLVFIFCFFYFYMEIIRGRFDSVCIWIRWRSGLSGIMDSGIR